MSSGSGADAEVTTSAGEARNFVDRDCVADTIMLASPIRPHVTDWNIAAGRLTMAGEASRRIVCRAGTVAVKATDADAADAVQRHPVAKGAGIGNISCLVVEHAARIHPPVLRMGIIDTVTPLATDSAGSGDADIEPRVTPRATSLSVANLANRQILFGNRSVECRVQEGAVQWMRDHAGSIRMAALAVEAGRKTARRGDRSGEGDTMASGTCIRAVHCGEAAMIEIGVNPGCGVDAKGRCRVEGMATETARHSAASRQVGAVATDAIAESGRRQGGRRVRREPVIRVNLTVG